MAITTYAELQSAVADFLNREDLASVIPTFISLAEADLQQRVRHYQMEARTTLSLSGQYTDLPDDWVETIRLSIGSDALELISQSELLDRGELTNDTAGQPRYYALTAGQLEVFPVPDDTYTATLIYTASIPALSDSNTSNWLLTAAPDAYLYGALMQSAPYLAEDARVGVWSALSERAIQSLNAASTKAKYSGTGLRLKIKGLS